MTSSSVSSLRSAVASTGVDPIAAEPGADAAVSGFDLLLAGAQSATRPAPTDPPRPDDPRAADVPAPTADVDATDPANPADNPVSTGTSDATNATNPTGATDTHDPGAGTPPTAKPDPATDAGELAALVAALAWTPPPVATPTPTPTPTITATTPGAADQAPSPIDANALADLTAESTTTLLDLAAAAMASSGPPEPGPSSPAVNVLPANHAIDTLLSSLSAPAPNAVAHPAPAPAGAAKGEATATAEALITANSTPPPPARDGAGGAPSERTRPSAAPPTISSAAATFTAAGSATLRTAPVAAADETPATAVTVAPPPPAEQLVQVLTPLRATPTGTYTLHLELKPPELGRVEMRVEMRDGVLHASIHADHESSAQLVRDALGELRDRLSSEGVHTGELTVSGGGVGSRGRDADGAPTSSGPSGGVVTTDNERPAANTTVNSPTIDSEPTSLLDVRV